MKLISNIFLSCLATAAVALDLRNSGVPPFHLMVFGDNPATNGSFVALRPASNSKAGLTFAVVDKSSPALIARVQGGELQSLKFDAATRKYKRLGPIGGLRKVKTINNVQRQALLLRDLTGAGGEFNKSSKGFYLDAPPGERAYFLYHNVKPELVNGFMICKNSGQTYYSIFYYEYKKGSPSIKGCEFVGLAVQQAK